MRPLLMLDMCVYIQVWQLCMFAMQAGADVAARNADGMSPLLVSAAGGYADCLRLLLKLSAADVTQASNIGTISLDCTPWARQVQYKTVKKEGAASEVNIFTTETSTSLQALAADRHGHTPLHASAEAGSAACLRLLLEASLMLGMYTFTVLSFRHASASVLAESARGQLMMCRLAQTPLHAMPRAKRRLLLPKTKATATASRASG